MKMGGANSRSKGAEMEFGAGGPCWQQCCWMRQVRVIRAIWSFPAEKGAALILVVQHLESKPRRRNSSVIAVGTAVCGTTKVAYPVDPQVVSHKISMRCWSQAMAAARNSGDPSAIARNALLLD